MVYWTRCAWIRGSSESGIADLSAERADWTEWVLIRERDKSGPESFIRPCSNIFASRMAWAYLTVGTRSTIRTEAVWHYWETMLTIESFGTVRYPYEDERFPMLARKSKSLRPTSTTITHVCLIITFHEGMKPLKSSCDRNLVVTFTISKTRLKLKAQDTFTVPTSVTETMWDLDDGVRLIVFISKMERAGGTFHQNGTLMQRYVNTNWISEITRSLPNLLLKYVERSGSKRIYEDSWLL